ncbi:MAG: cell division protein FtsL [Vicinamibacterales bacterium]|jgi:cell division protein FtsL
MSIDIEYAIKKDVRNNPIVRGVDERQRTALWRTLAFGSAITVMLLFSAWQHYQLIDHSYTVQRLLKELSEQEALNRRLRLEVDTLRAPALVEQRAMDELQMIYPAPADTLLIERIPAAVAPRAVVAAR